MKYHERASLADATRDRDLDERQIDMMRRLDRVIAAGYLEPGGDEARYVEYLIRVKLHAAACGRINTAVRGQPPRTRRYDP